MKTLLKWLDRRYQRIFTDELDQFVGRATILAAFVGFVVHLALLALAKVWPDAPAVIATFDGSYLSAIYTPFSFILFYELFALVLAIPKSFTAAVGLQLQIISLIVIRRIFGDIDHLEGLSTLTIHAEWVHLLAYDMLGALAMFFGVICFYRASDYVTDRDEVEDVESFVQFKRAITLLLALALAVTAVVTLGEYVIAAEKAIRQGVPIPLNANKIFYREAFTGIVFVDVAVLIISLRYSHRFELVFRNAGFVVATILLRLSLTIPRPLDLLFMVVAFVFAIAIVFGYGYFSKVEARGRIQKADGTGSV